MIVGAGLLAVMTWMFWSKPLAAARTVLSFLPPSGGDRKLLGDLDGWSSPSALAQAFLRGPSLTEFIRPGLLQEPEAERENYVAAALMLKENDHLRLQVSDGHLLVIDVQSPHRGFALAYSRALVVALRKFFHEERQTKSTSTARLAEMNQADEQLRDVETKTVRAGLEGPGLTGEVKLRYAVQHYREGLRDYRRASERMRNWESVLDNNSPEFVVVSGPSYLDSAGIL